MIPMHTTFHNPQIAGYDNRRHDALWGNCLSAVEQSSRILAESHESPLCNCKDTNKRVKNKIKIIFISNFRARVSYLKREFIARLLLFASPCRWYQYALTVSLAADPYTMKSAETRYSCVWNCHRKFEFWALIRAILFTDNQLGTRYASFKTIPAIHWQTINYTENRIFYNEEIRCLLKKA